MKLSNWAKKQGISYITAWRWFNEGKLPVKAYRSDSGTIIVQDDTETSEQVMGNSQSNDVMSMVLKKTVEYSKNSGTIEDFAAWMLSTFSLKLNSSNERPSYSRNKPKPEEVQKHFEQFLKPKGEKPKPSMFVAPPEVIEETAERQGWQSLSEEEINKNAAKVDTYKISTVNITDIPELSSSINEIFSEPLDSLSAVQANNIGGVVIRSVDSTPQLNYTGSTNATFNTNSLVSNNGNFANNGVTGIDTVSAFSIFEKSGALLLSNSKVMEVPEKSRRGRKPSKSFRKPE